MNHFQQLYFDYLDQLSKEISLYKNENDIWKLSGNIGNTPGNLCLHICGNLNHFFGAILGNTGYVRERDLEFSKKNVSKEELIKGIEQTKSMLEKIFDKLTIDDLKNIYPSNSFGDNVTIAFVLSRLASHLSYHIGQINYHRRILDN